MHDYRTVYALSCGPPVIILFLKARRELRMKYDSTGREGVKESEAATELGQ
jgi:hypothetical protein